MLFKYVIKTELIFRRVGGSLSAHARLAHLSDPAYLEARKLYDASLRFEAEGQPRQFVDTYRQVLARQCAASRETSRQAADFTIAIPALHKATARMYNAYRHSKPGAGAGARVSG